MYTQPRHVDGLAAAGVDFVEHEVWLTEDAIDLLGDHGGAGTPLLAAIIEVSAEAPAMRRVYEAEASERLRRLSSRAIACRVTALADANNAKSFAHENHAAACHGSTPRQALTAGGTAAVWLHLSPQPAGSLVTCETDPLTDRSLFSPVAVVLRRRRVR